MEFGKLILSIFFVLFCCFFLWKFFFVMLPTEREGEIIIASVQTPNGSAKKRRRASRRGWPGRRCPSVGVKNRRQERTRSIQKLMGHVGRRARQAPVHRRRVLVRGHRRRAGETETEHPRRPRRESLYRATQSKPTGSSRAQFVCDSNPRLAPVPAKRIASFPGRFSRAHPGNLGVPALCTLGLQRCARKNNLSRGRAEDDHLFCSNIYLSYLEEFLCLSLF